MKYTNFNTAANSNQSLNTTQMRITETSVVIFTATFCPASKQHIQFSSRHL